MKLTDRFFRPYAEYCLRTLFSEDELKAVLAKELPSYNNFLALFKTGWGINKVTFFRKHAPLNLSPRMGGRNSLRGEITVRCEKSEYSHETILHITIAPDKKNKWLIPIISGHLAVLVIFALYFRVWQMLLGLLAMPLCLFMVLASCRAMAETEVPKIRREFENTLRNLERKYQEK